MSWLEPVYDHWILTGCFIWWTGFWACCFAYALKDRRK